MIDISTNALIANMKALVREIARTRAQLERDDIDDDLSEELGLYTMDLDEALSALCGIYEERRKTDTELTDAESLLAHFEKEAAAS